MPITTLLVDKLQGRRNGSGRPSGCRTNNLTSKNFCLHYINFRERELILVEFMPSDVRF